MCKNIYNATILNKDLVVMTERPSLDLLSYPECIVFSAQYLDICISEMQNILLLVAEIFSTWKHKWLQRGALLG